MMQSESSRCEEEPPSLLWGLDPVFLAFAKLYIRDILDLKESCQVPGMWLVGLVTLCAASAFHRFPKLQKSGA